MILFIAVGTALKIKSGANSGMAHSNCAMRMAQNIDVAKCLQ